MRATDVVRTAVGVPMVLRPGLPASLLGVPATDGLLLVTRVLGARYVAQGLLSGVLTRTSWRHRTLVADALVDGSHAASMVPAAVLMPHVARPALASAALAGTLALLDGRAARRPALRVVPADLKSS